MVVFSKRLRKPRLVERSKDNDWPRRRTHVFALEDREETARSYSGVRRRTALRSKRQATYGPHTKPISDVYAECSNSQPAVTMNLATLNGKPCLAETRIPVALVLRYLATHDDPVADFSITETDVENCLGFAALVCDYHLVEYEE